MNWLNYHHLLYFWLAAREGSITKACRQLHLTQPTVSGQIRMLEKKLKLRLFERSGRSIRLTDAGQMVYRYADEIFSLGRELEEAIAGQPSDRPLRLVVGVADALPKLLVHQLLQPALALDREVRISCVDGAPDQLLGLLALHELDLVMSDYPANPRLGVKTFNHLLGDCGVSFMATPKLARKHRPGFPGSLHGAPLLVPAENTALRRALEQWFDDRGIRPAVRGVFTDSALLKTFGGGGEGVFAVPTVVEDEVRRMYRVALVGREDSVRERFYAISVEKRLKHPAVVAISAAARSTLG